MKASSPSRATVNTPSGSLFRPSGCVIVVGVDVIDGADEVPVAAVNAAGVAVEDLLDILAIGQPLGTALGG